MQERINAPTSAFGAEHNNKGSLGVGWFAGNALAGCLAPAPAALVVLRRATTGEHKQQ
jgi:hypothetical protein